MASTTRPYQGFVQDFFAGNEIVNRSIIKQSVQSTFVVGHNPAQKGAEPGIEEALGN